MPEIIVRKGEPIDRALKRLKGKIDAEGLMDEVRRLRAFETPVQRTRRKAKNNAKRAKTLLGVVAVCDELLWNSQNFAINKSANRLFADFDLPIELRNFKCFLRGQCVWCYCAKVVPCWFAISKESTAAICEHFNIVCHEYYPFKIFTDDRLIRVGIYQLTAP